jgi:hypothetical protein
MKRKNRSRSAQIRTKTISSAKRSSSSREKVRAHRDRMRARGFRLVQMWLPDTRSREFAARAHRASLAIANSPSEREDQAFIDAVSWWTSAENPE